MYKKTLLILAILFSLVFLNSDVHAAPISTNFAPQWLTLQSPTYLAKTYRIKAEIYDGSSDRHVRGSVSMNDEDGNQSTGFGSNLPAGTYYYNATTPNGYWMYFNVWSNDAYGVRITVVGYVTSAPNPAIQSGTQSSLTWTWGAVPDAQGYHIYDENGNYLFSTAGTTATRSGLQPGTTYGIKVASYNYDYVSAQSAVSYATTVPATPAAPTYTTARVSWSNNANNPGRGKVVLNWTALPGATGYKVRMFDGYTWRDVQDVGNVLTWDSGAARIYPSEATLDSYGDNTQSGSLWVTPTTGYDLPDVPTKLYKKTIGTTYDTYTNYWFAISAYNSLGVSPQGIGITPILPDATDTTAPTGTLIINDGAYNTSDRNVSLDITGNDSESGLYQMQFSSDNVSWTAWSSFGTTKTYQVGTDGEQKVYLKIKDTAGNISNIVSSSIFFINDTVPPDIKLNINNGSSQTFTNLIDLEITGQDNLTAPENIKMRVSLDGTNWQIYDSASKTWSASTSWGSYAAVCENFNLGATGGQKYIYVQLKDPSGNISNATGTVFYVTSAVKPATTTAAPVVNGTWGTNLNGKYLSVDGSVMLVLQGNSVSLSLTGISNSSELLTSFNGVDWSQADKIPTGSTTYTKDLSFSEQGKRAVFIKLRNEFGVDSAVLVRYYLIDYTPPTVEVKTASGATLTSGGSMNLLVKAKDNVSTKLAYRINGSAWAVLPSNGVISSGTLVVGRNQLNVEVIDESGNVAQEVVNVWKK